MYGSVKRDLTAKAKEEPHVPASSIPEKAKEDLRRSGVRIRVGSGVRILIYDARVPNDARVPSDVLRVRSSHDVSSDDRTIAKYATAKYGSTARPFD